MPSYNVIIVATHYYTVEADSDQEALDTASGLFHDGERGGIPDIDDLWVE